MPSTYRLPIALLVTTLLLGNAYSSVAATRTITCYKGNSVKKVQSVKPKCPRGFSTKAPQRRPSPTSTPSTPSPASYPPPLSVSPIDPVHVAAVSKFRSCSGHDYSPGQKGGGGPGAETARSMKHYIESDVPLSAPNSVSIFAPIAGVIGIIEPGYPVGKEVNISANGWVVRFMHIDPTVQAGDRVKAGDRIGTIAPANAAAQRAKEGAPPDWLAASQFDISVETDRSTQRTLMVSMFDLMTADVAALWAARGFTAAKTIVSKEARDAAPCTLGQDGEYFEPRVNDRNDWVFAS